MATSDPILSVDINLGNSLLAILKSKKSHYSFIMVL